MIPGLSCYLEVACFYARLVLKSTEKQVCPIDPKSGPRTKSGTGTLAGERIRFNFQPGQLAEWLAVESGSGAGFRFLNSAL
jgi:hypothetical protein